MKKLSDKQVNDLQLRIIKVKSKMPISNYIPALEGMLGEIFTKQKKKRIQSVFNFREVDEVITGQLERLVEHFKK